MQVHPIFERGFHQCDAYGSMAGLMEAHFSHIFASLHHVDKLQPMFPDMDSREKALVKLTKMLKPDPVSFAQQTICYVQ